MNEDMSGHFGANYSEARESFLQAAKSARAQISPYVHPARVGVAGEGLFIDVAIVGDCAARNALVLMSGTHGIEGYCGSAIQTSFLRSGIFRQFPRLKIILVHGLNPFGFSHCRRGDENNVDLNRNFVDFSDVPRNESYSKIANLLHRKPSLLTRAAMIASIVRFGFRTMQDAVTRGQYCYPEGLFFGGHAPSWSRMTWSAILSKHLQDSVDAVFIDYHTGLGKYGAGQILSPADPTSMVGRVACQTVSRIFGDDVRFLQTGGAAPESKSNDRRTSDRSDEPPVATPPSGDILNFTMESRRDGSFAGVFLEFGTLGPFAVLEALMAENAGRQLRPDSLEFLQSKTRLRNAFYPRDRTWQSAVLTRAHEVTSRAALVLESQLV